MKRKPLRKKCFERDNFICQKCKLEDKSGRMLEAHHKIPLVCNGKDEFKNLITLCSDCHHFAPNNKIEFEEYMNNEMDGTSTTLIKAWKLVIEKHSELFNEKEVSNENKSSNF